MAPRVRLELDRAQILGEVAALAAPRVFKVTRATLNRSTALTPKKTGNLANSQSMTMQVTRTSVVGRVETRVKYAEFVMRGTAPHTIRARRAKALGFHWARVGHFTVVPKKGRGPTGLRKSKKGVVFYIAKGYVRHPGTKARPFMFRALREVATPEGFDVQLMGGLIGRLAY